jgi:hypothetical protein
MAAAHSRLELAVHNRLALELAHMVAVGRIDQEEARRILAAAVEEAGLLDRLSHPWYRS